MITDKNQLWQLILGELELILSKANFNTWFKDTFISEWDGNKMIIGVPNTFTQSWLKNKYHEAIKKAVKNITKQEIVEILYKVESIKNNVSVLSKTNQDIKPQPDIPNIKTNPAPKNSSLLSCGLNEKYRFENFIVGKNNELAHAAAKAVARNPGHVYNPLFIYGGVGLGKTHLIQAVGHYVLKERKNFRVLYTTCEKFTNDFVQAIKNGQTKKFQDFYRNIDLLLIDDIQFMAGKEQIQEQFFHTFNELHQNNKQIIISSDRSPASIPTIEERLKSRFNWGMIADISSPDLETRMAILEAKLNEKNISLSREIINYIASVIKNNIRELEGALNRIIAHFELTKSLPDIDTVKNILSSITTNIKKGIISPKQIIKEVAEFYDIDINDITGNSRRKELVIPRQIVMYLIREETNASFPSIGEVVGGRDHTTVMHACKKIKQDLNTNEKLKVEIDAIRQRLYH